MESSGGPEKLLGGSTLRKSQKEGKGNLSGVSGFSSMESPHLLVSSSSPASSSTSSSLADSSTRPITMLQTNVLAPGHADLVTRESELAESTEHDG